MILQYVILTYTLDAVILRTFHINTCRWDIQHSSVSSKSKRRCIYMCLYMNILGFCCEKLHTNRKVNKNKYALEWMNYLKEKILITITWPEKL